MTEPVVPPPAPPTPTPAPPVDAAPPPETPGPSAPPQAPAGPRLVGVKALEGLSPDAPLTEAYKAGAIGFHSDERVPVRLASGELGSVRADELAGVVDDGGALVHPSVLHQAKMEAKYGGGEGTAGAVAAGAARGATVGLSDPIALAAAGALGGGEGREAMRERLTAYKELHPYASVGGELAGVALPGLLTGGAAAEAEGASLLARGGQLAARGARGAGALSEGVGALGRLAEGGATRALARLGEHEGASLARRMAETAIAKGAGGAVEGALFGAGGEISESSLDPNHPLTAEKLLASMGHGAVLGAAIGGGLGAGAEAVKTGAKAAIAKASPFLRSQSEELAVRALDAKGKYFKELDRLPGGRRASGRDLLDATVTGADGAPEKVLAAGDTVETLAPKLNRLADERFQTIESQVAPVADATVSLKEVLDDLHGVARSFDGQAGKEGAAAAVRKQIEQLRRIFTPGGRTAMEEIERLRPPKLPAEPELVNPALASKETVHSFGLDPNAGLGEETEAQLAQRMGEPLPSPIVIDRTRPGHIGEGPMLDPAMREGADVGPGPIRLAKDEAATAKLQSARIDANRPVRLEGYADQLEAYEKKLAAHDARVAAIDPSKVKVSLGDLLAQRRIYESTIADTFRIKGSVVAQGKKAVGRTIEDLITERGERAAAERGLPAFGESYKAAKLAFRRARVAADAADDAVARVHKNASHSLTDKIFAGEGALAGFVTHGPVGAAVGLAAGAVSKAARTRADSFLARAFDRLSGLQAIARRTEGVDAEIAQGVKDFAARAKTGEPPARLRFKRVTRARDEAREEYSATVRQLTAGTQPGVDHGAAIAPLAGHAPTVAAAFAQRAAGVTAWLASQVPPTPKWGSPTPSDQEIHAFLAKKDAATNPVATLAGGLARGDLTVTQTQAIAATWPELYASIQRDLQAEVQDLVTHGHYLDYGTRRDLSLLFGVPSDWSMTPDGVRTLQTPPPPEPKDGGFGTPTTGGPGKPSAPGPRRRAGAKTPEALGLQTAAERRQGGELR